MNRRLSTHVDEPMRQEAQQYRRSLRRSSLHILALAAILFAQVLAPTMLSAQTQASISTFWEVQFFAPDTGWLFGSGRLLRTTDGGQSWTRQQPTGETSLGHGFVYRMQFLNATHGWILSEGSRLSRTTDGGQSWQATVVAPPAWRTPGGLEYGTDLDQFQMVSQLVGFGLDSTGDQLLRTTDGGMTWHTSRIVDPRREFRDVFFLDATQGWVTGVDGRFAHTTDGGQTWQLRAPIPVRGPLGIQFLTETQGWVLETDGHREVYRTTDGGQTWARCVSGQNIPDVWRFMFRTPTLGWAAASKGVVLRTTDGCATWQVVQTPVTAELRGLHFVTDTIGWAVGDEGAVLKTADGGLTWTLVPVNVP
jgi:photosystem II stability/assembly factor-like uncharacterized protein